MRRWYFKVLPNVFPPGRDTRLLITNFGELTGATVLDMGAGCGVLAMMALHCGAKFAVAADISADAIQNVRLNREQHNLQRVLEVRQSDGFAGFTPSERFDLIIANLPGRRATAADAVQAAQWDTDFKTHRNFFRDAAKHLNPEGRILMAKANYPELNEVISLGEKSGFRVAVLATDPPEEDDPRTYYALSFCPSRA